MFIVSVTYRFIYAWGSTHRLCEFYLAGRIRNLNVQTRATHFYRYNYLNIKQALIRASRETGPQLFAIFKQWVSLKSCQVSPDNYREKPGAILS